MKYFIKKILSFIIYFVSVVIIILACTTYRIRSKAEFPIKGNYSNVIIGHSHAQYAYNDSIISDFINLSEGGEHYLYTYHKIVNIINQNPNIKTVFVEFTNNQIKNDIDEWVYNRENIDYRYLHYFSFFSLEEHFLVFYKNPLSVLRVSSTIMRKQLERCIETDFNFTNIYGGYSKGINKKEKINWDLGEEKSLMNIELAPINIRYLKKIVSFCNLQKINLFLIRSPLSEKNEGALYESYYQSVREESFRNVEYIDNSNFPLKSTDFTDYEHMNYKGANKYSIFFNDYLRDLKLSSDN